MAKSTKIFLGGTCVGYDWRDKVKDNLMNPYFDPYVRDREWTEKDRENEIHERRYDCSHMAYVLTSDMDGFYAVAEVTEDMVLRPGITSVCFLEVPEKPWSETQLKSIAAFKELLSQYSDKIFDNLDKYVVYLNQLR